MRRSLRRQAGGEVVEFALTLLLFFFLLFVIIDFSVAVYDQGALVSASRIGARQGSLYWVDPNNYDPGAGPADNTRLSEGMISSAVTAYAALLMNPGSPDAISPTFSVAVPPATTPSELDPDEVLEGINRATVTVDVPFEYAGMTRLPGAAGMTLRGITESRVEFAQ